MDCGCLVVNKWLVSFAHGFGSLEWISDCLVLALHKWLHLANCFRSNFRWRRWIRNSESWHFLLGINVWSRYYFYSIFQELEGRTLKEAAITLHALGIVLSKFSTTGLSITLKWSNWNALDDLARHPFHLAGEVAGTCVVQGVFSQVFASEHWSVAPHTHENALLAYRVSVHRNLRTGLLVSVWEHRLVAIIKYFDCIEVTHICILSALVVITIFCYSCLVLFVSLIWVWRSHYHGFVGSRPQIEVFCWRVERNF